MNICNVKIVVLPLPIVSSVQKPFRKGAHDRTWTNDTKTEKRPVRIYHGIILH